jgi:CO/xanthine dehydrogenase Mo-binding subunit
MFVDDIPLQNACFALIIRAPDAKGTLLSVSCPTLAPDYCLIKAEHIPGKNTLADTDMPLLAKDHVSYIGEPVALLVGPDKLKLSEYANECKVEIERTSAFFSIASPEGFFSAKETESGNTPKSTGDILVEGHYETGIQEHWYSEPHGAIAEINAPDGQGQGQGQGHEKLLVKTSAKDAALVKQTIARALLIEPHDVHVELCELGIHLDGKIWYPAIIASLASLAAFITKKTVKLQLGREEDYLFSPKRTPSVIHIKSVLSAEKQILATEIDMKIGFGAYAVQSDKIVRTANDALLGIYKTGRLKIKSSALQYTVPPTGPFAGFGSSLASFALERHISKICDSFKEEGSDWRRAHLQGKLKSRFQSDEKGDSDTSRDILSAITEKSVYKRKWAAYELLRYRDSADKDAERILPERGIGLALSLAEGGDAAIENSERIQNNPIAAAVIEIEIDRINYEAKTRNIWLYVSSGRLKNQSKARQILRRASIAALGWTSTEKIKFENGKITPNICANYQILPTSETPPISIDFIEEDDKNMQDENELESLPFSVIPSAYTQAITQAVNHHFERIPITGQDVWRVMNIKRRKEEQRKAEADTKEKDKDREKGEAAGNEEKKEGGQK